MQNGSSPAIRVCHIEGNRALRMALEDIFAGTPGFRYVGAISSREDASRPLLGAYPQVAVVGWRLPGIGGLDRISQSVVKLPLIQIVALSHFQQPDQAVAQRSELEMFSLLFAVVRYDIFCDSCLSVNPKSQQRGLSRHPRTATGHPSNWWGVPPPERRQLRPFSRQKAPAHNLVSIFREAEGGLNEWVKIFCLPCRTALSDRETWKLGSGSIVSKSSVTVLRSRPVLAGNPKFLQIYENQFSRS
jgi:hypothetical protein